MANYTINATDWSITDNTTDKTMSFTYKQTAFIRALMNGNGELVEFHDLEKVYQSIRKETDPYDFKKWIGNTRQHLGESLEKHFEIESQDKNKLLDNLAKSVPSKGYIFTNKDSIFEIKREVKFSGEDPLLQEFERNTNALINKDLDYQKDLCPNIKIMNITHTASSLAELLSDSKSQLQCVILDGGIGSGKTTTLEIISTLKTFPYVPIYIKSSDISSCTLSEGILMEYAHMPKKQSSFTALVNLFKQITDKGKTILLLIDGLDELSQDQEDSIREDLCKVLEKNKSVKAIITTRYMDKVLKSSLLENTAILSQHAMLETLSSKELPEGFDGPVSPLTLSIHRELMNNSETYNYKDKYQLFKAYYDYAFNKYVIANNHITNPYRYASIFPLIAHFKKNTDATFDYTFFETLESTANVKFNYIFRDETFPKANTMQQDLIKFALLTKSGKNLDFKHNDFLEFTAAKFLMIQLENGESLRTMLTPLMETLLNSTVDALYNKHINYYEYCFNTMLDYVKSSDDINEEDLQYLMKFGLIVAYYQGYSMYNSLKNMITEYIKSIEKNSVMDLSIISASNDFIYSILREELDTKEKKQLLAFAENTYDKIRSLLLNDSIEKIIPEYKELHGSIKNLINSNPEKSTDFICKGLCGIIHGNIGATFIGKAKNTNEVTYCNEYLNTAILNHKCGLRYKERSAGAIYRNHISIATDYFYKTTLCNLADSHKDIYLTAALIRYDHALEDLNQNYSDNIIDKMVCFLNKAGCTYNIYELIEDAKGTATRRKKLLSDIQTLLISGIAEMKKYSEEYHCYPIRTNINNLFNDLNEKHLPVMKYYKRFSIKNKTLFITSMNDFCDIYNKLHFTNPISFDSRTYKIKKL